MILCLVLTLTAGRGGGGGVPVGLGPAHSYPDPPVPRERRLRNSHLGRRGRAPPTQGEGLGERLQHLHLLHTRLHRQQDLRGPRAGHW